MKRFLFCLLLLLAHPAFAQKPPVNGVAGPTTSQQLRSIITDATGSGALNFGPVTSLPNGVNLGTPSAGVLTNATGLPIATGVSGLGAGVASLLATPFQKGMCAPFETYGGGTDKTGAQNVTAFAAAFSTDNCVSFGRGDYAFNDNALINQTAHNTNISGAGRGVTRFVFSSGGILIRPKQASPLTRRQYSNHSISDLTITTTSTAGVDTALMYQSRDTTTIDLAGTTTSSSTTVTGISDTSNIAVGALVTGTGIPQWATVWTKTSTTVTLSKAATASGSPTLSYRNPTCCNDDTVSINRLEIISGDGVYGPSNVFTGTSHGTTIIDGIADTSGIIPLSTVTAGPDLPALGTYVVSKTANSITLVAATTGGGTTGSYTTQAWPQQHWRNGIVMDMMYLGSSMNDVWVYGGGPGVSDDGFVILSSETFPTFDYHWKGLQAASWTTVIRADGWVEGLQMSNNNLYGSRDAFSSTHLTTPVVGNFNFTNTAFFVSRNPFITSGVVGHQVTNSQFSRGFTEGPSAAAAPNRTNYAARNAQFYYPANNLDLSLDTAANVFSTFTGNVYYSAFTGPAYVSLNNMRGITLTDSQFQFGGVDNYIFASGDTEGTWDNLQIQNGTRTSVTHDLTTTSGSRTATVDSATGLVVGQIITATSVPPGGVTTIEDLVGTTVTLSIAATATATTSASFKNAPVRNTGSGDLFSGGRMLENGIVIKTSTPLTEYSLDLKAALNNQPAFTFTGDAAGFRWAMPAGGTLGFYNDTTTGSLGSTLQWKGDTYYSKWAIDRNGNMFVGAAATIFGGLTVYNEIKPNGSASITATRTVRNAGGASDCTMIFTFGILTGGTCAP